MKTLLHKRWGITLIALVYSALWGFAYPTVKMTMESFAVVASGILLGEDVLELRYLISVLLISFGIYVVNTGGMRRGDHL